MERQPEKSNPWSVWLERGDRSLYTLIAAAFLVMAGITFIYGWAVFFMTIRSGLLKAVFVLVNEMLLVLIILEMLGTILNYLKVHAILLEPFLHIGIIASIRRILSAGAHHSITEPLVGDALQAYLWDVGINAVVIILLSVALFLFSKGKR
ncbi:MAG: phosphate-starvation-inducible PsiE family protein [Candidatus Manganitrophaceae bacterium]